MFDEIAPGFILRLLLTPRSRIASRVKTLEGCFAVNLCLSVQLCCCFESY